MIARFDRIPTSGLMRQFPMKRLTLAANGRAASPLLAEVPTQARSTPDRKLMKWCAGLPKSIMLTAEMQTSARPVILSEFGGYSYKIPEHSFNLKKNGIKYIGPCMESHTPFDLLIIMLGSNDCKRKFAYSAMDIAGEMQIMLEKVQNYNRFRCRDAFKVLLVSPPTVSDAIRDSWLGDSFGYENAAKVSGELATWYKTLAEMYDCDYLDASKYVRVSDTDGIHLDAEKQKKLGKVIAEHISANA